MTNVITANLSKCRFYRASPVYQYNYGMILKITGVELPTAYEVDFSNDVNGTSITQIGNADGVTIPSQFFVPGQAIYCWLRVHPTADSGVTTATIVIPISPRATITDDEPTPEEQSAIDEAIAALNDAVDKAEDAVEHYPTITNGVWYVWDVDAGEYVSTGIPAQGAQGNPGKDGNDGISPTITVAPISGGHRITITDANGTHTVDVLDGENGDAGRGIVSVQKTGTAGLVDTYTITYTDSTTSTFTVTNGQNGTDGVSPTVTVTDITGGHRITITDATGAHSFDVMDGQDGQGAVQDVQVNGTSVVTDGVANVPTLGINQYGVAKIGYSSESGLEIASNGNLRTSHASANNIKSSISSVQPITPDIQHASTFYGLAKAAGADMASSSNEVGTYTDAAKVAIQKMLGVYREWEKIVTYEVAEDSEQVNVNIDSNGQAFNLSEMYVRVFLEPSTTGTNDYVLAKALITKSNDAIDVTGLPTVRYQTNGIKTFMEYQSKLITDVHVGTGRADATPDSTANIFQISSASELSIKSINGIQLSKYRAATTLIPQGTIIEIYGIRQ